MEDIVFGIDIGTTKICALVGAVRNRCLLYTSRCV